MTTPTSTTNNNLSKDCCRHSLKDSRSLPITAAHKFKHSNPGFTYVELILVIIIITMAAGISGSYYVGTHKKTMLKSVARNLLLKGKYARLWAIENSKPCKLHLNSMEKSIYLIGTVDSSINQVENDIIISNPYCRKSTLADSIELEHIDIRPVSDNSDSDLYAVDYITFFPDGSCDNAVIQFGNGKDSMTVVFSSPYSKADIYEGTTENIEDDLAVIDLDKTDS